METPLRIFRERAVASIFQPNFSDVSQDMLIFSLEDSMNFKKLPKKYYSVAYEYVVGINQNRQLIDAIIEKHLENWTFSRLGNIEKCILRMSVFEILKKPEIPLKVIFDESVEISKKYCDDESSKFVNGILDRISRDSDIISHKASD